MLRVYAIYDAKLEAFMRPFCAETDGVAWRAFYDLVADAAHPVGQWPQDYSLHCLGKFDAVTGKFDCPAMPEEIAEAAHLRRQMQNGQLDMENDPWIQEGDER